MLKRIISAVLLPLIILAAMPLSACSKQETDYPLTVGSVTLAQEPENVVVLDKNLADIISAVGYDVKLVGRSEEVTQKGLKVVPEVGSASDPSAYEIIKTDAEIVFAGENLNTAVKTELENAGVPVAVFEKANTKKQLKSLYSKVGALLGGSIAGAKRGADAYKSLMKTFSDMKSSVSSDKVLTVGYFYIENGVLKTFTSAEFGGIVLDCTGAVNVFGKFDTDVVDPAKLALAKPDYIICADKYTVRFLKKHPTLRKLPALRGRTFLIPYDSITMQGETSADALGVIMKKMYPGEFAD